MENINKKPSRKEKLMYNPFLWTVIIIIIMAIFFLTAPLLLEEVNSWTEAYEFVDTNNKCSGTIIDVKDNKGFAMLTLSDSSKIWFRHAVNYDYKPYYLFSFLEVGDSIQKNMNSDTLDIYRNGLKFYFILGEYINEK